MNLGNSTLTYTAQKTQHFACSLHEFLSNPKIPKLSDELRSYCEGELTISECSNVLNTFQNNK